MGANGPYSSRNHTHNGHSQSEIDINGSYIGNKGEEGRGQSGMPKADKVKLRLQLL
jgi:type V secretory pathway adhesin AidA